MVWAARADLSTMYSAFKPSIPLAGVEAKDNKHIFHGGINGADQIERGAVLEKLLLHRSYGNARWRGHLVEEVNS